MYGLQRFFTFVPESDLDLDKSLVEIDPGNLVENTSTGMLQRLAKAVATPIGELSCAQIRLLVGQQVGLDIIGSAALEFAIADPRAQIDFYPGDLSMALLRQLQPLLIVAPQLTKAFVALDFDWMKAAYDFDPDLQAESEKLVAAARARVVSN